MEDKKLSELVDEEEKKQKTLDKLVNRLEKLSKVKGQIPKPIRRGFFRRRDYCPSCAQVLKQPQILKQRGAFEAYKYWLCLCGYEYVKVMEGESGCYGFLGD